MRIVWAAVCVSLLLLPPSRAFGQNAPRWELGPSISTISLGELGVLPRAGNRGFGFGARAVWNISEFLGAELQFARVSRTDSGTPLSSGDEIQRTHHQLTASVKGTWRLENSLKINPFALAGIGGRRDTFGFISGGEPLGKFHETRVALRFGGGIEIVPQKRFSIRFDASNLASRVPSIQESSVSFTPAHWWNRLDISLSMMVRSGSLGSR
jgi:hypothetical protein